MTLADVCVVACAEAFRGDGEIVASPMGTIPTLGVRLARATFEPDLVLTDGEAAVIASPLPVSGAAAEREVEGWLPFRSIFDVLWSGRRHVMMGASQIDAEGNQNIACIGPWEKPKAQLLGVRGAPGNTANHPTSYWVPSHTTRSFVPAVDFASGIGHRRAAQVGGFVAGHHEIRRIVTNLAVLDFETDDSSMRLRSVHPGVTVDAVVAATGFPLTVGSDVPESRGPTAEELAVIDALDPEGIRHAEVK